MPFPMMLSKVQQHVTITYRQSPAFGKRCSGLTLPNNKIFAVTKLKAFADNKINEAQMMISVFDIPMKIHVDQEQLALGVARSLFTAAPGSTHWYHLKHAHKH